MEQDQGGGGQGGGGQSGGGRRGGGQGRGATSSNTMCATVSLMKKNFTNHFRYTVPPNINTVANYENHFMC